MRQKALPYRSGFNVIVLTLLWIMSGSAPAVANELAQHRDSLQQVQQQISTTAEKLQEKQQAEQSMLQQLENLDREISGNDSALNSASRQLQQLQEEILVLRERIGRNRLVLARSQKDIEKRLKALYTSGDVSSLRLIFSTETPLELTENLFFLSRIANHDKHLLDSYRQRMNEFNQAQSTLEKQIATQQSTLQQQQDQKKKLVENKKQRLQLVNRIRRDKSSLNSLLKELEERSQRMAALVETLEKKQASSYIPDNRRFDSAKGQIPWPSSGAVRSAFGTHNDKNFGTRIQNNGLEIAAVAGTRIQAIWPGKIVFSAPFQGYGNLIIIDHGHQYYSLYAQTAQLTLAVGSIVEQGQVITTSGHEGRDSYYLEIRKAGTPLDPQDWLQPRTR